MTVANTTELYIFAGIKSPRGGLDTINFDGDTESQMLVNQTNYYVNHPALIFHGNQFSPIHEDSKLKLSGLRTDFERANYLMYQFNGKWYYAFINGIVQQNYDSVSNKGTVLIQYEIDIMQTFLWQIKQIKHTFTVRRHLPNNRASISPRIYDELLPLYKNIVENKKYGLLSDGSTLKWLVIVSKAPTIGTTVNGDINPFSYLVIPVKTNNSGIAIIIPKYNVNGTASTDGTNLGALVQVLTGNQQTDNTMTSQVVNFYLQDEVPFKYTVDSSGTINITDTGCTLRTDPGECIQVMVEVPTDKKEPIDDIVAKLWGHIQEVGGTEWQLVNSNLCGASIANSYGSMDLQQKYLITMTAWNIMKRSNLTPQGDTVTTLDHYMGNNLIAYQMGIRSAGKQQTVISNATATYMQANKNAYAYKQDALNLQQSQLNATQHLQQSNLNKNISFQQRQFNINYGTAGDIAFYGGQAQQGIGAITKGVGDVVTGFGMGGIAGGVLGGVNAALGVATTGANLVNNFQTRGLQKDKDQYAMDYAQQSVNLSQQQQQQNMDMARKAFAAENADRALQPLTINQMGLSTSLDYMNDLYADNIVFWVSDGYTIKMANNELLRDGTFTADYYDFSDMMKTRPYFNKIMIADRIELALNQSYKEMIEMALTKGVRFWNYSARNGVNDFESHYMTDYNCG